MFFFIVQKDAAIAGRRPEWGVGRKDPRPRGGRTYKDQGAARGDRRTAGSPRTGPRHRHALNWFSHIRTRKGTRSPRCGSHDGGEHHLHDAVSVWPVAICISNKISAQRGIGLQDSRVCDMAGCSLGYGLVDPLGQDVSGVGISTRSQVFEQN